MTARSTEAPSTDSVRRLTRRSMVGAAGLAGAGLVVAGRTPVARLFGLGEAQAAGVCASLTPEKTIGPYFVEEKLNRSDIRVDPSTGATTAGVLLQLDWTFVDEDNGCAPVVGAQVDLWHANPAGKYSDEASEGTSGQRFLRGYQVTDSSGVVRFTTVYPGWYAGRTVHMHVRIRIFDASGAASYDFTSQIFFDDALTDAVYAASPYGSRGTRTTRNANDGIYGSDGSTLVMSLTGSNAAGYAGTFAFGLSAGGRSGTASSGSGSSGSGSGATPVDTVVGLTVPRARFVREAGGTRALLMKVRSSERVSLDVRLRRGTSTVRRVTTSRAKGVHWVRVPVAGDVPGGRVILTVAARDKAQNRKVVTRTLRIPVRTA
jgi:protocatechuate 3,4-dioxygenase beta subunit